MLDYIISTFLWVVSIVGIPLAMLITWLFPSKLPNDLDQFTSQMEFLYSCGKWTLGVVGTIIAISLYFILR